MKAKSFDRLGDRSRMRGDVHVRFSESAGVKFPRATQPKKASPGAGARYGAVRGRLELVVNSAGLFAPFFGRHVTLLVHDALFFFVERFGGVADNGEDGEEGRDDA